MNNTQNEKVMPEPSMFAEVYISGRDVSSAVCSLSSDPSIKQIQIGFDAVRGLDALDHLEFLSKRDRRYVTMIARIRRQHPNGDLEYSPYQGVVGLIRMQPYEVIVEDGVKRTDIEIVHLELLTPIDSINFGEETDVEEINRQIHDMVKLSAPHLYVHREE